MPNIRSTLEQAGIHPHGTPELALYQERLTRYFTREYRRLEAQGKALQLPPVVTNQGPMWKQTVDLMQQHFDQDLALFKGFLDPEYMAYTMGYYGETANDVRASSRSLEQAERAKFELACNRSGIQGDERVFNIGCGFGPLDTYIFDTHPEIDVTSITPSRIQIDYIESCRSDSSHPLNRGKLRLIEGSFGEVPVDSLGVGKYDLVIGIGCFEHINNLDLAFERIAQLLRPGGRCFLHLICSRIVIPRFLAPESTLMGHYFPGGKIWPYETIAGEERHLRLDRSWFINGMNYWRTIDEWHRRFWDNIEELYSSVLKEQAQVRFWNDYFVLCKACFAPFSGTLFGNGHYLFRKR